MIEALRPGGWLLLEEADPGLQPLLCPDEHGEAERLANVATGRMDLATSPLISARARKPS